MFILNYKKKSNIDYYDKYGANSISTKDNELEYLNPNQITNNSQYNEGTGIPNTTNKKFESLLFNKNYMKFQEYSEKVDKISEKVKLRFSKLREKCFDPCTSYEFEAFEKEISNSFDNCIKRRNSIRKVSNGGSIIRLSNHDIPNNNQHGICNPTSNSVITKKRSLKIRKETFSRHLANNSATIENLEHTHNTYPAQNKCI